MSIELSNIGDYARLDRYLEASASWTARERFLFDKLVPVLLFGIIGAFGWAIRGTGGWGGMSGAVTVGLWWGFLFYYLAKIRGVDARWQCFFIGLGIGWGGMTGYGQFLSWIRGDFGIYADQTLAINPAIGFVWLTIIGIEWGGTAAALYAWTLTRLEKDEMRKVWFLRVVCPAIGGLVGYLVVSGLPNIFFPFYDPLVYNDPASARYTGRTAGTLPSLATLLGIFLGLLAVELYLAYKKRRWQALKSIAIIATAFAVAFPLAACWFFLDQTIPFGWWKVWEESIGFLGGLGIGLVFLVHMKVMENRQPGEEAVLGTLKGANGTPSPALEPKSPNKLDLYAHLFLLLSFAILFFQLVQGVSETAVYVLGFVEDPSSADSSVIRWVFVAIFVVPCLILVIRNAKSAKQRNEEGNSLFEINNLTSGFLQLCTFAAVCGFVAIGYNVQLYFYILFYWAILSMVLFLHNFLKKSGLQF